MYLIAGLAIFAFSGSLIVSLQSLSESQAVVQRGRANETWTAFSAELEYLRLMRTLSRYALGESSVGHDELMTRFDIFWSRIPFPLASTATSLRRTEELAILEHDIEARLSEVEPLIVNLKPGDLATYEQIRSSLEEFGPRLHEVLVGFDLRFKDGISFRALDWLYGQIYLSFAGIMVGGGAILFVLIFQLRQSARLSEAYRQASIAADVANETKSEFLARMTHELRTPLNAVIGYSEMLHEDAVERGYNDIVDDLERIRSSGKHLLSMINTTLDLSKIETGRLELETETVDVEELVRDVSSAIFPLVNRNENRFEYDITDAGTMSVDPTKLRQILFNLLSNAAKFTHNGIIGISVRRQRQPNTPDFIHFTVRDTGIGIPKEKQERVFDAFEQADPFITRKYGGTGLGLAVAKSLSELMGGTIEMDSEPDAGTTFTVKLPADTTQSIRAPRERRATQIAQQLTPFVVRG